MTLIDQHRTIARPRTAPARRVPLVGTLLIWNAAWQEYSRMKALDADALRDMGLTEADRDSVTVSQIARRMHG